MNVDPSAFIWVHAHRGTIEANVEAAAKGSWISLDNVRYRPDAEPGSDYTIEWYADRIVELKKKGLLHKVLLSHDSGWYDLSKLGGARKKGTQKFFNNLKPL